ncbi:MAG: LysM peptidoglycan-binding domain-containing protein [Pseudomonadota bacterium]
MAWKEDDDLSRIKIESEREEFQKEIDFQSKEPQRKKPGWFKIPEEMPIGLIAIVIAAIAVLFILFIPNTRKGGESKKLAILEQKMIQLEDRMVRIEGIEKKIPAGDASDFEKKAEQLKNRMERIETSLSMLTKQVEEKQTGLKPKTPTETPQKATPEKPIPKPAQVSEKYHTVETGETLYSISRKYEIKPDELLKINNLPNDSKIYPGQKLLVGPQKKN